MKVVLDINALLVSIPKKSKYRLIFDLLIAGEYEVIISNNILSEYMEILERKTNSVVSNNIAQMLLHLENVKRIDVFYEWNLIEQDPDDNKYVDAAISAGVDFLVSNDQHFKVLSRVDFPKVTRINIDEFLQLLKQRKTKKDSGSPQ